MGIFFTLVASWLLTRTVLQGEASAFTLELPPYRRPSILRILYTSLIDRTIFVSMGAPSWTAAPAGAVIWILGNIEWRGINLAQHSANFLNPLGEAIGLDGVILLAYVIAIPANEIVVAHHAHGLYGSQHDERFDLLRPNSLAACRSTWLDNAYRRKSDAFLGPSQSMCYDHSDDLERNA